MKLNERIAAWALPLWMLLLTLPQLSYSTWEARKESEGLMIYYQSAGALMFVSFCFVFLRREFLSSYMLRFRGKAGVAFFLFFFFVIISCIYSEKVGVSLVYALSTYAVFVAFNACWEANEEVVSRAFKLSAIVLLLFMVFALVVHGMPGERTVGGIVPNRYAKIAFVFMVIIFYVGGRSARLIASFVGVFFVLLVTSRSSLVAVFLFCFLFFVFCFPISHKKEKFAVFVFGILSFLFLAALDAVGVTNFYYYIFSSLDFFDHERGLGSGLTGRTDYWADGIEKIYNNPVGYGFRGDKGGLETAHNGYLNLLLDVGFQGFATFFIFTLFLIRSMFSRYLYFLRAGDQVNVKKLAVALAFLCSGFVLWFSEPSYINIGLEFSVIFVMFLSYPGVVLREDQIVINSEKV